MIWSAVIFRSASGFSEMNMRAGVGRAAAAAAGESVHGVHRRVGLDDVDHLQQDLVHGLERGVLVGLNRCPSCARYPAAGKIPWARE